MANRDRHAEREEAIRTLQQSAGRNYRGKKPSLTQVADAYVSAHSYGRPSGNHQHQHRPLIR